jgi:hypothetical protein
VVNSESYEAPHYNFLSSSVTSSFSSETSLNYRLPLRCDTEINISININISDVEVATFGEILGNFSLIVPPSAAGFARVVSDAGDTLWRELERSNRWSSKLGV